jgi:hypothetical protein
MALWQVGAEGVASAARESAPVQHLVSVTMWMTFGSWLCPRSTAMPWEEWPQG